MWARRNSLALTVRSGIAQFSCIGKKCYGLPTLDCNSYSQAYSPNDPNPEHPIPSSITCTARSCRKTRDPAPSTEQDCNRIASVGRLFGNRRRTEWRSVGAVACSDDAGGRVVGRGRGCRRTPPDVQASWHWTCHGAGDCETEPRRWAPGGGRKRRRRQKLALQLPQSQPRVEKQPPAAAEAV